MYFHPFYSCFSPTKERSLRTQIENTWSSNFKYLAVFPSHYSLLLPNVFHIPFSIILNQQMAISFGNR